MCPASCRGYGGRTSHLQSVGHLGRRSRARSARRACVGLGTSRSRPPGRCAFARAAPECGDQRRRGAALHVPRGALRGPSPGSPPSPRRAADSGTAAPAFGHAVAPRGHRPAPRAETQTGLARRSRDGAEQTPGRSCWTPRGRAPPPNPGSSERQMRARRPTPQRLPLGRSDRAPRGTLSQALPEPRNRGAAPLRPQPCVRPCTPRLPPGGAGVPGAGCSDPHRQVAAGPQSPLREVRCCWDAARPPVQ